MKAKLIRLTCFLTTLLMLVTEARAQGTAFTYQGRLNDGLNPASGVYDLRFTIYDTPANGTSVGGPLTSAATTVSNGLFTVTLDFGAGVFDGNPRWLEIGVRTNGSLDAYSTLISRQPLTPSPYAITAGNVTGPINGAAIVNGTIGSAQLAPGAAAANLGSGGQSGVASGGAILSADPHAQNLLNAGYVRLGKIEAGDVWERRVNDPPTARVSPSGLWTGSELIVWGGLDPIGRLGTGARYNPAANAWLPVSPVNAPQPRDGHVAVWTGSEMIVWGGQKGLGQYLNDGGRYSPAGDTWCALSASNAPAARAAAAAVWAGTQMVVWGGVNTNGLNTGGRYDAAADQWSATSTSGSSAARDHHTAVWTGSEMIVWGGSVTGDNWDTGGRYNPLSDTWGATSTNNAPQGRMRHSAVWTGSEMIVWGGDDGDPASPMETGGRYNPSANTWLATSTAGAPERRNFHTAVWTGSDMIVWGGYHDGAYLNSGGRYHPASDLWQPVSTAGTPTARQMHVAVWTGRDMIVWGGDDGAGYRQDGGRYRPGNDTWTLMPVPYHPPARGQHTAVWTGSEMITWGGFKSGVIGSWQSGDRYDPAANSWRPLSLSNAPASSTAHSAVWTGTRMIVWGGYDTSVFQLNTGGLYDPVTDTWTPTSTTDAPVARGYHRAVWTGTEMIVWGGLGLSVRLNDGGRYNPVSNVWSSVNTTNAPPKRMYHSAVWTGNRMIVWGGQDNNLPLNTGGLYDPSANAWTTMPNGPAARQLPSAIWTGTEMIVWGGLVTTNDLGDGARYNPSSNTWAAVANEAAPMPRYGHTAIWTGKEMIVWGGLSYEANAYLNSGGRYDPALNTGRPPATMAPPRQEWITPLFGRARPCSSSAAGPAVSPTTTRSTPTHRRPSCISI